MNMRERERGKKGETGREGRKRGREKQGREEGRKRNQDWIRYQSPSNSFWKVPRKFPTGHVAGTWPVLVAPSLLIRMVAYPHLIIENLLALGVIHSGCPAAVGQALPVAIVWEKKKTHDRRAICLSSTGLAGWKPWMKLGGRGSLMTSCSTSLCFTTVEGCICTLSYLQALALSCTPLTPGDYLPTHPLQW